MIQGHHGPLFVKVLIIPFYVLQSIDLMAWVGLRFLTTELLHIGKLLGSVCTFGIDDGDG